MPSTDPVSSISNCYRLIVSLLMTQYTASSSSNAQLSQLDLVSTVFFVSHLHCNIWLIMTIHFSIWFWRLMMMAMKKRLCFVTFHFAFESRGNYLVSAHSYGPYHLRHNFSRFSFLLSQYHSPYQFRHNFSWFFVLLENVFLSHICLLGDVREKVHATRKHGWKVQTGHWNCLWQLWYFSTFLLWDFGLLIHHKTGGSCDL